MSPSEGRAPFAYFQRLSPEGKRIYEKSDSILGIALPEPERLRPLVARMGEALSAGDKPALERAATDLARGLTDALGAPPVEVRIDSVRPSSRSSELHGLYTLEEGKAPRIRLWMKTARRRRVVAFRTFLRTLLHEVCHHLDYTHFRLADSFHTAGFFRRESSLFQSLVPPTGDPPGSEP